MKRSDMLRIIKAAIEENANEDLDMQARMILFHIEDNGMLERAQGISDTCMTCWAFRRGK